MSSRGAEIPLEQVRAGYFHAQWQENWSLGKYGKMRLPRNCLWLIHFSRCTWYDWPGMEESDTYVDADDFPVNDQGIRMCPRCACCSAGVGPYSPPTKGVGALLWIQVLPKRSSLSREPSNDPSVESEAWYCYGGCNDMGEHYKGEPICVTFIGRVKRAA